MKYIELLNYILDLKARGEEIPTMTQLAKETGVSKVAIHHNFKSLLKYRAIKKVGYGKYDLNYDDREILIGYTHKRMLYLEKITKDYVALKNSNEELERSNIELRKSREFYKNQGIVMDGIIKSQQEIIKSQQERIKKLEEVVCKKPRYKRIFNFKK